ncbi:MAG TPA: formyltransferase family protein, partial [Acidimicrobiales bacterium]|nr:formyltransferase family protein [Acidimicrobiales bacterium]
MRTAVLASGSGTLLDAILSDGIPVDLVVVDRPCAATEVAERHGVQAICLERTSFGAAFDREGYTGEVTRLLLDAGIELVVMAGYGTVFGAAIHAAFPHRILNTHPALLPAFKGWHAVDDAL